jgi:hypothetical protein
MELRLLALALLLAACGGSNKALVIPEEMRRAPADKQADADKPAPKEPDATRAVLRMAERGRTWELELPDQAGPYEVRVPLAAAADAPTLADAELVPAPKDSDKSKPPEGPRRSYLSAVARVRELHNARRDELALIELANVEADFPDDARLWAMKGTLLLKLGKKQLAKAAWQKSLALAPDDGVAQALRELGAE